MTKRKKKAGRSGKPGEALPSFKNEDEEREFRDSHDSPEYVDWSKAQVVKLTRLKPSTATISLRLPESLLNDLKVLANQRDVPYQSLLKIFLAERIEFERRRKAR